jgi:hypothetical protein
MIELVKKNPYNNEEEIRTLAKLPRETYAAIDPYFGGYFVAYKDGKLIAMSKNWDGFLSKLRNLEYYVSHSSYLLDSPSLVPSVKKTISAGLSDSGDVVDPFGALDARDYGVEPLKAAYAWVRSMYGGRNAALAAADVVLAENFEAGLHVDAVASLIKQIAEHGGIVVLETHSGLVLKAAQRYGVPMFYVEPLARLKPIERLDDSELFARELSVWNAIAVQ